MIEGFVFRVTSASDDIVLALQIRGEVFTDEQGIPAELDSDGKDESAHHVLCFSGDVAVGTGRLITADDVHGELSRIAVRAKYRGYGLGRQVVQRLEAVAVKQGLERLSLQPHKHLEGFYGSLGYHTVPGTAVVGEHELITMAKDIRPARAGESE